MRSQNTQEIKGVCRQNYPLNHLTWFKVGGLAEIFFKPYDLSDLSVFLKNNNDAITGEKLPVMVLGAGSNLIIRDKGFKGIIVKLGQNFTDIELLNDNLLIVGAGSLNFNLAKFCLASNLGGFEFLVGIPGTVGGGIAMNAGCYGSEFKDIVHAVEAIDGDGNLLKLSLSDIGFYKRGNSLPKDLIFTKVWFNVGMRSDYQQIKQRMEELVALRKQSQPITEKTGGSTFVNPEGFKAWELIDKAGMRGAKVGGARMSELHCNFMINDGSATAKDLEQLGELVRQKVKAISNIELQWEIKIVGI